MTPSHAFAVGALMFGYAVVAVFFLRFWRNTGDRLFGWFAFAFLLLSLNQIGFLLLDERDERTAIYVFRLLAFGMIIRGVIDKNRRES